MKCLVDIRFYGHVIIPVDAYGIDDAEVKGWNALAEMDSSEILDYLDADVYSVTCDDKCNYRW